MTIGLIVGLSVAVIAIAIGLWFELRRERREVEQDRARLARALGVTTTHTLKRED